MTPEQINDLRQRVLRKEPVSDEELRQAIETLRGRRTAPAPTTTSSRSKKAPAVDLSNILADVFKKPA